MFKTILQVTRAAYLIGLGILILYLLHPFAKIFLSQSEQTEGAVVQIIREGWSRNHGQISTRTVRVVFTTKAGKEVYFTEDVYGDNARSACVGKRFPVRYNPRDPGMSDIGKVWELYVYGCGIYVVGGGLIMAGLVVLYRMLRGLRKDNRRQHEKDEGNP